MQLSIIIINFNTFQTTVDCIQSVYHHTEKIKFEIILIDNFPKEDRKKDFHILFPEIQYILSKENIGFGRANNLGMLAAKGKYILLLNSDTLVKDKSIEKCIDFLNTADERTGMLGCKLLNADGSYQPSFYPFIKNDFLHYCISNNPLLNKIFGSKSPYFENNSPRKVGDISGAFMLLKKEVFEKVNGFDPDFFLYYEETDWCRNRILKEYNILYYPYASIVHLGGASAPKDLMYIQSEISFGLYWYKKGLVYYLLFLCYNIFNLFTFGCLSIFKRGADKTASKKIVTGIIKAFPYWITDIPRFSRKYGSRNVPLIYKKAKTIFFSH